MVAISLVSYDRYTLMLHNPIRTQLSLSSKLKINPTENNIRNTIA